MAMQQTEREELTPTQQLSTWIGDKLQIQGSASVKLLELYAQRGRSPRDRDLLWERERPEGDWRPEEYFALADEIAMTAQTYADGGMPGLHTFMVIARTQLGREIKHQFRMRSGGEDGELEEYAGDSRSVIAQQMRHNEFLIQTVGRQTEAMMRAGIALQNNQAKLLEELNAAHEHVRQANLSLAAGERELLAAEHSEKRKDLLTGQIGGLAVGALTNVLKKYGLGNDPMAPIVELVDSLAPEQIMKIADALDDDQRKALGELLKARHAQRQAQAQKAQKEGA